MRKKIGSRYKQFTSVKLSSREQHYQKIFPCNLISKITGENFYKRHNTNGTNTFYPSKIQH